MFFAMLLGALPLYGPVNQPPAALPAGVKMPTSANVALIVRSSSTNTAGYRLWVFTDGRTRLEQGSLPLNGHVSKQLVERFFTDLAATGPVDGITARRCMKSMSFGTSLTIAYRGRVSPDLSCPGTARALETDALSLADAAGVTLVSRPMRGIL
jgi:predicted GNAT family acetyltransferase